MSYSKSISFPEPPAGFNVTYCGPHPVAVEQVDKKSASEYERGKAEATHFYQTEIRKLRDEFAQRQDQMLADIDQKTKDVVSQLDDRLPDLVVGLSERVLGKIELDAPKIEGIVRGMISEFANAEEEKLEVYLCQRDLSLLKAMANTQKEPSEEGAESEEGFASAIAGIFDSLDGMTPFLPAIPA